MKQISILLLTIIIVASVKAHDYIPGKNISVPVLLKNGNLHTIANGYLPETDLLFIDGKISAISKDIPTQENYRIYDITGKHVYPGLIAPNSSVGLIEIGAAKPTIDKSEIGRNNADVQSHIAYNPDSEIIPTIRSNGVTTALIVPSGSLIAGRSSLINMDGWTKEDAMVRETVALHISYPQMQITTAWWMEKSAEEQQKENEDNLRELYKIFDQAKAYYLAKSSGIAIDIDLRLDALYPVFDKKLPVFVHASSYAQIESAIIFSKKYDLEIVIVGGTDAWKISDKLRENNIPVIISRTQALPTREDEGYDLKYRLPYLLYLDSVKFCLSYGSYTGTRNLPFQAAQAVAFGLPKEIALRSVTLATAEILGVQEQLGSLEIGKSATIVVSEGDILDHQTHKVVLEFIDGKEVDLNNKHKELYQKYRQKSPD